MMRSVAAACVHLLALSGTLAVPAHAQVPASDCIDAVSYLPLDSDMVGRDNNGLPALGTYERVSPDGRFVLRSYSSSRRGAVSRIELPADPADRLAVC